MALPKNSILIPAVVKKVLTPFDAHDKHFFPIYFDAVGADEKPIGFYGMIYPQVVLSVGEKIYVYITNYKGDLSMRFYNVRK